MPAPEKVHQCDQYVFNDVAASVELSEPCSGRPTFVSVVQPAHFSNGDDAASIGAVYAACLRRILLQCEVCASPMIMGHEVLNCRPQRAFAEQDHPFQTGFLDAADKSFSVGVQIRRSRWQLDGLDTNILEGAEKPVREQPVPIMRKN